VLGVHLGRNLPPVTRPRHGYFLSLDALCAPLLLPLYLAVLLRRRSTKGYLSASMLSAVERRLPATGGGSHGRMSRRLH